MTEIRILPGHARGTVAAPPSKSLLHRALIAAALSEGESRISRTDGPALSEDILATIDCLKVLGCELLPGDGAITVRGIGKDCGVIPVEDPADEREQTGLILPVRASGSTLRFLIPLVLSLGHPARFVGEKSLFERPLDVYEELCQQYGMTFRYGQTEEASFLDICGRAGSGQQGPEHEESRPGPMSVTIQGHISSQFATGLLFALPLFPEGGRIELIPPIVSRPYIEMTRQILERFGIWTCRETLQEREAILIPGGQRYTAANISIEGDESQAAFLKAIPLLDSESEITITGLDPMTRQGDRVFPDLVAQLKQGKMIDLSDTPDLGPILFGAAAGLGCGGTFTGTARLREKESDRVRAMAEELGKFGIQTKTGEDSFTILPGELQTPEEPLQGHGDHRIVMALAVLLIRTGGVIRGAQAVRKSDPTFFERLQGLGIHIEERNEL